MTSTTATPTSSKSGRKALNKEQRDLLSGTSTTLPVVGWLVWWSILDNERNVDALKQSAQTAGLPQSMIDRIEGRSSKTAWQNATQLGSRGKPSRAFKFDPAQSQARYLVRDLKTESRALIREVVDAQGEQVSSNQVAVLYHLNNRIEFTVDTYTLGTLAGTEEDAKKLEAEIRKVVGEMSVVMTTMVGSVDDSKIRGLLLSWLESVHRVCVRGTGGVYFIPRPKSGPATAIEDELTAWRTWVNSDPVASTFSIVEINAGGRTTVQDFAQSAIAELKEEIATIEGNLQKWADNGQMNDGSRMFSSQTMIEKADQLKEKAGYLADSLGEELYVMIRLADVARAKAVAMNEASTLVVTTARAAKIKPAKDEGKLSGTAAKRGEKVAVE